MAHSHSPTEHLTEEMTMTEDANLDLVALSVLTTDAAETVEAPAPEAEADLPAHSTGAVGTLEEIMQGTAAEIVQSISNGDEPAPVMLEELMTEVEAADGDADDDQEDDDQEDDQEEDEPLIQMADELEAFEQEQEQQAELKAKLLERATKLLKNSVPDLVLMLLAAQEEIDHEQAKKVVEMAINLVAVKKKAAKSDDDSGMVELTGPLKKETALYVIAMIAGKERWLEKAKMVGQIEVVDDEVYVKVPRKVAKLRFGYSK
jgi:hypothetical protein